MNMAVPKDNWLDKKICMQIKILLDMNMKIRIANSYSNFASSNEYSNIR